MNVPAPRPASLGQLLSKTSKKVWALVIALAVLASLTGFLALLPKVSVASLNTLNPVDPFSSPFTVSNDGYFDIYDVAFGCSIHKVNAPESNETIEGPSDFSSLIKYDTGNIRVIGAGEKATALCPFPITFDSPIREADIAVVVSYRPAWLFWRQEKKFRFMTADDKDHLLHWYPQPLSK